MDELVPEANDNCISWHKSRVFLSLSGQKKKRRQVYTWLRVERCLVLRFQLLMRILGRADGSVDMVLGGFCRVVRVFMFGPLV